MIVARGTVLVQSCPTIASVDDRWRKELPDDELQTQCAHELSRTPASAVHSETSRGDASQHLSWPARVECGAPEQTPLSPRAPRRAARSRAGSPRRGVRTFPIYSPTSAPGKGGGSCARNATHPCRIERRTVSRDLDASVVGRRSRPCVPAGQVNPRVRWEWSPSGRKGYTMSGTGKVSIIRNRLVAEASRLSTALKQTQAQNVADVGLALRGRIAATERSIQILDAVMKDG